MAAETIAWALKGGTHVGCAMHVETCLAKFAEPIDPQLYSHLRAVHT